MSSSGRSAYNLNGTRTKDLVKSQENGMDGSRREAAGLFDFIEKDGGGRVRYHYVLADFLCERIDGDLGAASDVTDVRLVSPDELDAYELTAKALEVIRSALKLALGGES